MSSAVVEFERARKTTKLKNIEGTQFVLRPLVDAWRHPSR